MMPVTTGHEQCVAMLEYDIKSACRLHCGKLIKIKFAFLGIVIIAEISKAQHFKRFTVKFVLLFERKQQHAFAAEKLCMYDMAEVNIKMHVCDRTLSARKQHGHLFYKAFHQV